MGWLRDGELRVGLGAMRLSTERNRDEAHARSVVFAALDAGVRLFDTAHAYGLDERELGHNERWLGKFLAEHPQGAAARVITKGGMRRQGPRWIPDGRASTLEAHCAASAEALGRPIDLYLLHAPDLKTGLATSVRALRSLLARGLVRAVGLSNVNHTQLDEALALAPIAAVQLGVSLLDDTALRGGVVALALSKDVSVLCHSPLGGPKKFKQLGTTPWLAEKAREAGCTPWEWALAQLLSLSPNVAVLPGARRVETVRSCVRAASVQLGAVTSAPSADAQRVTSGHASAAASEARGLLDASTLTEPRSGSSGTTGARVVLLMGPQGAGKTTAVEAAVREGLTRLNRDEAGGTLEKLHQRLGLLLHQGQSVVLDNMYVTRAQRGGAIAVARRHGARVHGVWHDIAPEQAHLNIALRMLAVHGRLLEPRELERGRTPDTLSPRAFQATLRQLEPLGDDEGFDQLTRVPFVRRPWPWSEERPALFVGLESLDAPVPAECAEWPRIVLGWREGGVTLGAGLINAVCPHPGGPPTCWCRPPFPGALLFHARAQRVRLGESRLLSTSPVLEKLARASGVAPLPRLGR